MMIATSGELNTSKQENISTHIDENQIYNNELAEAYSKLTYNTPDEYSLEDQYKGLSHKDMSLDINQLDGEEDFSQW